MKRLHEIVLPFLITGFLFFAPFAHAQGAGGNGGVININIDVQGIINAINGLGSGMGNILSGIPDQVLGVFGTAFKGSIISFNDPLMQLSEALLTSNPDPSGLYGWWQSIILVISSLYLLLFMIIGFMFLFSTLNPEKRMEAKEWLKNAFMMIVLVGASFALYDIMLDLATAITQFMWINGFQTFFDPNTFSNMGAVLLIFYGIAGFLTAITLFVRHIFLLIGVVLFPIAIFLYFVPPLKVWGRVIFNLIGIALFMQFLDVVIFVASNQAMQQLAGNVGANIVPVLAFTFIFILNILLMVYAVLKSVFTATENSKILGFAIGTMTGQISALVSRISPPSIAKSSEVKV